MSRKSKNDVMLRNYFILILLYAVVIMFAPFSRAYVSDEVVLGLAKISFACFAIYIAFRKAVNSFLPHPVKVLGVLSLIFPFYLVRSVVGEVAALHMGIAVFLASSILAFFALIGFDTEVKRSH